MITLIKSDGTEEIFEKIEGDKLKFLQEKVGGYIELVYLTKEMQLICNEEGLIKKLFINEKASILANQTIVGDVVVLTENDVLT